MRALHIQHGLAPVIVQKALEHGLLLNSTAPDTLRMIPPLNLKQEEIDEASAILDSVLAGVAELPAAEGK